MMIRYNYPLRDYRYWLKGLAKILNLHVRQKKMELHPSVGQGYVYASSINPDMSFIIANCSFKDDLVLIRKKTPQYGLSLTFSQVDVSDFFKMSESKQSIIDRTPRRSNILLSSTNYDLELTWSKNSSMKMVSVLFSSDFVQKVLKKDVLLDIMLYTGQRLENVNKVPITFEYRQLLDDIYSADMNLPISNLVIQNRILLLTEKFLNTFLEKRITVNETGKKLRREKEKDLKALKDVEDMLSNGTLDKFPSIDTLSKAAMMSSTKLKTKFKTVYGMKLYEFYNRNRLEKAKEMLQTGRYSVKEVGHDIGFSNLSNFAKAFKKEFGFLPNEMLRN
ncbi:MAG: hypothetical protein C5B59_11035 [Bacteroidetes bacterium]|nr:MAG: hypothetical protein C5B59_11035 [Bacteroidota bacterium]